MKKKQFRLVFLLLSFALVLSGCGECKHEWQEADCLNAKICTQCQLVEGDALGHDWQAATCETLETCARCGQTQGELLPHVFGEWVIGETDMSRSCQNCSAAETAEIDRELYMMQKLAGHWDFHSMSDESEMIYSYDFKNDFLYYNLHVDQEKGSWWCNGDTRFDITIEYLDYQEVDDVDAYTFAMVFADDGSKQLMYYMETDGDGRVLMRGDTEIYHFVRNQELVDIVTGAWAENKDGQLAVLELNEDRTFAAEVDGETFNGTWHLRGMNYYRYSNDETTYASAGLDLLYQVDGVSVVKTHNLSLGEAGGSYEEALRDSGIGLRLTDGTWYVRKHSAKEIELIREGLRTGPEKMPGQWTSSYVSRYTYASGESTSEPKTDYTAEFHADGTFTMNLDKVYTGTWTFDEVSVYDNYADYDYKLKANGSEKYFYANINSAGEMNLTVSDDNESLTVRMLQMTPEMKAQMEAEQEKAKDIIVGDWNSYTVRQDGNTTTNTGYTITFLADGTFTTNLEEGKTGTWKLGNVDINTQYNTVSYNYRLTMDGYTGNVSGSMYNADELTIYLYEDTANRNIKFSRLSKEDLKKIEEAPMLLAGTWSGSEITRYNEETQKREVVRKESHTLTVNEDGSYTSTMPGHSSGTWNFWEIEEDSTGFIFIADGGGASIFYLEENGVLDVWFEENGEYLEINLTKK